MNYLDRFTQFILENKGKMKLYYSQKFRDILYRLSENGSENTKSISKYLLNAEHSNQAEDEYTLIDVSEKNDKITLVQVSRIIREYPNMTAINIAKATASASKFWKDSRTEYRLGKWVTRIFVDVTKSSIENTKVEEFVNSYKALFDKKENQIHIVEGEDIRKSYLSENYFTSTGQLGSSCMRYENCQSYLDLYTNNPEVCRLLVMFTDDGKVKGRALLWKLTDETYFMDRVYTNYDSDKKIFEEFATENGWEKYPANKIIKVQLKNIDFNSYPYMDTLSTFNLVTGVLTNTLMKEEDWVILQSTNGSYEGSDGVWSEFHQESIPENEAVWCENINSYSWSELSVWLEYKSEYAYDNGGIVYSEYDSSSYFIEDTVYSEITDEYYYLEGGKFIEIQTGNDESNKQWIPEDRTDLYIKIDDQYYYKSEYIKDPYTNKYHFKDEMIDGIRYNVLLLKKLEKELGTVTEVVIKELVDIYKTNNYDKDSIIKSISENKEFEKYILVAWGLSQELKPNEEDMIVALFTHMTSSNTTTNLAFLSHIAKFDDKEIFKKFQYWQVQKQRLINNIRNNFCKSFDVSLFGSEIYKRYLFLNI